MYYRNFWYKLFETTEKFKLKSGVELIEYTNIPALINSAIEHLSHNFPPDAKNNTRCLASYLAKYFNVEYNCPHRRRKLFCRRCTKHHNVIIFIAENGDFEYFAKHHQCSCSYEKNRRDRIYPYIKKKLVFRCYGFVVNQFYIDNTNPRIWPHIYKTCYRHYCECEAKCGNSKTAFLTFIAIIKLSPQFSGFIATYMDKNLLQLIYNEFKLNKFIHNKLHYVDDIVQAQKLTNFYGDNLKCPNKIKPCQSIELNTSLPNDGIDFKLRHTKCLRYYPRNYGSYIGLNLNSFKLCHYCRKINKCSDCYKKVSMENLSYDTLTTLTITDRCICITCKSLMN